VPTSNSDVARLITLRTSITLIEYETGYRDDGTGTLSCFGWARIKLEELHEARKLAECRQRELHCRQCGGSLREGHVEGYCWSCWGFPPIGKILTPTPPRLGSAAPEGGFFTALDYAPHLLPSHL
jgi:hypothetical protein